MSNPMASSSETSEKQIRPISFLGMNVNQVKSELNLQLEEKEKLISDSGSSQIKRNALRKQSEVIKKELVRLNRYSQEEELPQEVRSKLENLANDFQCLKTSKPNMDEVGASKLTPLLPPPPTNSSPTKHRNKNSNGNRRNPDIEFATEIGQGLLIEVRKLQTVLQEKEEFIKQLELTKADNERIYETAQRHLKQRDEIEERLKEEVWNLEVVNQELQTQLTEFNQSVSKHNSDVSRLTKQLKSQSEQLDIMKAQEEKSSSVIEAMKARHEQETHVLRKHAANAQRENSQIQKQLEALNTELKIVQAKLAIKMASSSRVVEEQMSMDLGGELEDDKDSEEDQNKSHTPPNSGTSNGRGQHVMETETLKQSLAHAHRIISNLRSSLHKEKLEKFEVKKMLSESQETVEQLHKEIASNNTVMMSGNTRSGAKSGNKKKTALKKKRGGIARKARGLCPSGSDSDQLSKDEEVSLDSEEEDSLDEEHGMDQQHFTNYGNSFGSMFDFGHHQGLSSVAMKPLSSELESKIQVIDAGINTEPIMVTCEHCLAQNSPLSPSDLLVGDHSSFIKGNDSARFASLTDLATQTSGNLSVDSQTFKEQVTKALIQERQVITKRAVSILSLEQIDTLLGPSDQDVDFKYIPALDHDRNVNTKDIAAMVPKSEVEKRVLEAVTLEQEKTSALNLIPKLEAEKMVQEAVATEQTKTELIKMEFEDTLQKAVAAEQDKVAALNLIPMADAEYMVQEAVKVEKAMVEDLDLIPKVEAEKMVQQAVEMEQKKTAFFIPKAEAEKLTQDALVIEKARVTALNLIPKTEADQMIEQVTEKMKKKTDILIEEARIQLATQQEKEKEELLKEMIPKREVEAITLAAVALAEKEAKISTLESTKPSSSTEEMISKKEADMLVKKATETEQRKIQQALDKQKVDVEIAANMAHKIELDAHLEKQKLEMDALKKAELDQLEISFKATKQEEVEKCIAESEAKKQIELEQLQKQISSVQAQKQTELKQQDIALEVEIQKQLELEQQINKIQAQKQLELEEQRVALDAEKQEALVSQKKALEMAMLEDMKKKEQELLSVKQAEAEKLKLEAESAVRTEFEKKIVDLEATKRSELEELHIAKSAEIAVLSKSIETYKKECEETNNRMITMLTKDSADVLVKRAIANTLEKAEKTQAEVLSGMISREYAMIMVKDEIAKALEAERKEVSEREDAYTINMISKAEAEALAKVAAADAIVKERQAMVAKEKGLITKEEAEAMAALAAREAADKEKSEAALNLAKERKLLREKEERMISKEEAEQNTKEAVRVALLDKEKNTPTSHSHHTIAAANNNESTRSLDNKQEKQVDVPEKSVSTSRLTLPAVNIIPAPSVSTPTESSSRRVRLSSSVSSLRLGSGRKENNIQKNQRPSMENGLPSKSSFGSFRILDSSKYNSTRLQSKSSISLKDLSNKQNSTTSISTMSSDEGHNRTHLPIGSEENFPGFGSGGSSDAHVISAITQTMIGEWMSKHTRRYVGSGISDNNHQRFFWVHPYTKILYWSSIQPGAEGNTAKTKSAFIESVSAVPNGNTTGSSPMSLLIRTPKRSLKITATTAERHELWLTSLSYLLGRPNDLSNQSMEDDRPNTYNTAAVDSHQLNTLATRASERSVHDILQYDSDDSEDNINIRQCCDGKHDVATLSKNSHHHHS